ncbi:MAG: polymer-forming cytoskeletal protein [Tannerella sp.]|jgi:cytoskeletal protein CcmA (bactofilin family)|nr:polymer-forming cytoskeletal protein [Tannerella sp.]
MVRTRQNEEVPTGNGGVLNVLAVGTTVKGSVVTVSDFRLDGRIEGDITCSGKIVIGQKGSIKGNIVSDNAEILGEVEGTVKIKEKLVFKSTAVVTGDIHIQTLEIEPGARFNGTCTMAGNHSSGHNAGRNMAPPGVPNVPPAEK